MTFSSCERTTDLLSEGHILDLFPDRCGPIYGGRGTEPGQVEAGVTA